ncbi:hypothetical protein SAMN04488032_10916 [Pacificibacter marinus]|uniref:Uncharacterized protein n=1 Tax=Pacificibacter marinus TaxID=658057 RepID=A0A1Y5T0Q7_9RHOB|nr:hypothetical protein SAMN04488032_10916 [Pacificibacter marinus]SLN53250.1 hypothetical protein PAM7971_02706 [Pacificibacter marinus]
MAIKHGLSFGLLGFFQLFLRLCTTELHRVLISLRTFGCASLLFTKGIEIYGVAHGV